MKKVFLSLVFWVMLVFAANCQTQTQSGQTQSAKQLFRMIKVSVPDSVVFTLSEGKMIEGVSVYLVSGEQSFEGVSSGSGAMHYQDGKMYISDQTVITSKFKTPVGFKALKIKFEADGKTMYYNIAKKAWDPIGQVKSDK